MRRGERTDVTAQSGRRRGQRKVGAARRPSAVRCCRCPTGTRGSTRQVAEQSAMRRPITSCRRLSRSTAAIDPGERKRSLFTVVVYTAKLKMRGRFAQPRWPTSGQRRIGIPWDRRPSVSASPIPRGIARAIDVSWNGQRQRFVPGSSRIGLLQSRIQAPAPGMTPIGPNPYPFELDLELKGTRELRVVPAGNDTTVQLTSSWPHPSFVGTAPDPPRVDARRLCRIVARALLRARVRRGLER